MIERFLTQTTFTDEKDFQEHFHLIIPDHFNFAYDVMDAWAEECPEKTAMIWVSPEGEGEERRFTFGELKELTDRTAAYFHSLGLVRGDRVMLILKRRYEWWLAILACHKLGLVAIPASYLLTSKDILYRNNKAAVRAIVCVGNEYVTSQITEALPDSPTVQILVSIGPIVPEGWHDWHKEWTDVPTFVRPEVPNENEDTMLMYFTSGTTGEPKMVAHDFLYALGHLTTGVYWHNLSEESIHVTIADTGWGKAVWGKLYGQWFAGATVFVFDEQQFSVTKLLSLLEEYHVTSFCAPPTVYRMIVQQDISPYDLSALKYCTTAGEALGPVVFDKFQQMTGLMLREGYGQTETTETLGTFPWTTPRAGSLGKPNPQYDVVLLDDEGRLCEDGVRGEICIRADRGHRPVGLFKGYEDDPDLTSTVWHDGYYHTRDLAWRDSDGYYWFIGRDDEVIKSSGYRIDPYEVENALMTHPAVAECAVTGAPDALRGNIVKATIVLSNAWKDKPLPALTRELQKYVKQTTAPYKYPRLIEFVKELPKTISGKVRRVELRDMDLRKGNSSLQS